MDDMIERYRKLYSGVIYDALRLDLGYEAPFVLDKQVHRLSGPRKVMVGFAVTARGRLYRDAVAADPCAMFEQISQGDVLVLDTMDDDVVAHFGDVSVMLAREAGAAGCVVDGYTRDADQLAMMGFPVFGRGVTPQDTMGLWGIDRVTTTLSLRGTAGCVTVCPGDLIFGDGDGVLVIPPGRVKTVLEAAEKRAAVEREMLRAIQAGKTPADVFEEFGQW